MSRHRNVRGYNYDEDFEDDDVYGQSVEDDYCISPSTAAQFIYSRRDKPATHGEPLEEDYDYEVTDDTADDSSHQLTEVDRARLNSCLDQMREVLAESVPEQTMVQAVLDNKFDVQKALDFVLSQDNKQNVKTKNQDAAIVRKTTKGDLLNCPEVCTDTDRFSCAVGNVADNSNKPGFGNVTAKSGSACYSLITNEKMLLDAEKSNMLPSEGKGLQSSSLVLSSFSGDLCKGSFCEPMNKQAESQLPESTNAVSLIPGSEDVCFSIGSNPSSSFKKLECKATQDLKSLLKQNVVCDSLGPEDSIPLVSSDTSDCHSNANLYSSPCLTSALGKLALDNEVSHTVNRKHGLENFSSLVQSREQEIPSSNPAALLRSGSTSLADLLQEPQKSSAGLCYSLADLYTQSAVSHTDMKLATSPLSQLLSQPQASGGMSELTGSLSSLTLSKVSPVKEVENLSLSDLIAEAIEIDKTEQKTDFPMLDVTELRPSKKTSIDLSALVKNADVCAEQNVVAQSNIFDLETKISKEKQGKCSGFGKTAKKPKRGLASKKQDLSLPWMRTLCAKPSAFALTLCLRYPPKGCKRRAVGVHKAFLYSRQVGDVKPKETCPVIAITPFDFKSASPDDIVKANQKKAFTRE